MLFWRLITFDRWNTLIGNGLFGWYQIGGGECTLKTELANGDGVKDVSFGFVARTSQPIQSAHCGDIRKETGYGKGCGRLLFRGDQTGMGSGKTPSYSAISTYVT
jgi:hypothetical protein